MLWNRCVDYNELREIVKTPIVTVLHPNKEKIEKRGPKPNWELRSPGGAWGDEAEKGRSSESRLQVCIPVPAKAQISPILVLPRVEMRVERATASSPQQ